MYWETKQEITCKGSRQKPHIIPRALWGISDQNFYMGMQNEQILEIDSGNFSISVSFSSA